MPSLAPGEQQEPVTCTHKDSGFTFPRTLLGPYPDTVSSPTDEAAKEKHPTHKADLTEIPSPAARDMATARSQLARPAGDTESPEAHVTPYHHLLYNILREEQKRRVPSMPTGKDRAVLPGTEEKAHLPSLLGQVSKAPRVWERRQETVTLG